MSINTPLFLLGSVCIIAAIVGGGLKVIGNEFPILSSRSRQLALAGVGVILVVISLLSFNSGGSPSPTSPGSQQQIFSYPTIGGYRLDWCYSQGTQCGIQAATEWCKTQGYNQASDFVQDYAVSQKGIETKTVGDGGICIGSNAERCDSFITITCRK